MVTFVPLNKLKPGMVIERDIYGKDKKTSTVAMLKSGEQLNSNLIAKVKALDISGVYIHGDNKFNNEQVVDTKMKVEVLDNIKNIYDLSEKATQALYSGAIRHANDVLDKLIDTIVNNENTFIDIDSLRMYDDCTYNHSLGVTVLTIAIGKKFGLTREQLSELALCALLHDIGKMRVPIEIITKPGKLTKSEFEKIKEHPEQGGHILTGNELVNERILRGVVSHHEKYNGTGYPYQLKGDEIPLYGRIITVADVYDALTANRPYRTPTAPAEAIEYVMGGIDRQFDGRIVNSFLQCISPYPVGSCVKLSNGQKAVIVEQNSHNPMRPKIFMMNNPNLIVDLFRDINYLNIVIENLCENLC